MRNVINHAPTPFGLSIPPWMRNVINHTHIVFILLQSYHTNTDRMYHICKKLYHICNFQRNLLENVRYMYTLRQIGISFSLKTDLRQPYGRDLSRSAHRVQYIAWHCISPPVVFIRIIIHNGFMISERDESHPYACRIVFFSVGRNVMNYTNMRQCLSPHRLGFQPLQA